MKSFFLAFLAAMLPAFCLAGDPLAKAGLEEPGNGTGGQTQLSDNPLKTQDQFQIETQAIALSKHPKIIAVREQVKRQWLAAAGQNASENVLAQVDSMVDEYVFLHLLLAVNGDGNYPKLTSMIYAPPHQWFGMEVPGSRVAGPNPDNNYRMIPIDPAGHYQLTGQLRSPKIFDFGLSLMSDPLYTRKLPILEKRDIVFGNDGSFTVVIAPEPAEGRSNHLQTSHDTELLFIRETRTAWNQAPIALQIKRLNPPGAPPMTGEQTVDLAVNEMLAHVPYAYWWLRLSLAQPVNRMSQPKNTGEVGGLVTQATSFGHADLQEDEALVITVNSGGAGYHGLAVYDYWYRNIDPAKQLGSFNNSQAAVNSDGTFTYVISAKDPGFHNWLGTDGQNELLLIYRWQNLPLEQAKQQKLFTKTALVKLADLQQQLPAFKKLTSKERQKQVENRKALFQSRFQ